MSSLFHYTRVSTLIEKILPAKCLKTGSLSMMNDPRESQKWAFFGINIPYDKIFEGYYCNETHIDCQYKFGQIIKSQFQVVCFSGAKSEGWNNEMMWAHYGDNHKGVCLEFDEEELASNILKTFETQLFHFGNVNYYSKTKKRPAIYWEQTLSYNDNLRNNITRIVKEVALSKSHFWEKEDERRLLFLNAPDNLFIDISSSLKAIYLGLDFVHEYLPAIERQISEVNVALYDVIYQNYRYERWPRALHDNRIPITRMV